MFFQVLGDGADWTVHVIYQNHHQRLMVNNCHWLTTVHIITTGYVDFHLAGNKPFRGPDAKSNPVKLTNISILATYLNLRPPQTSRDVVDDPNAGVVETVAPGLLKLPSRRQIGWWKLLLRIVTETVPVVSDRRSMATGWPTRYVPATRADGIDLPGAVMGVSDMTG
jgi:hypothetical protein